MPLQPRPYAPSPPAAPSADPNSPAIAPSPPPGLPRPESVAASPILSSPPPPPLEGSPASAASLGAEEWPSLAEPGAAATALGSRKSSAEIPATGEAPLPSAPPSSARPELSGATEAAGPRDLTSPPVIPVTPSKPAAASVGTAAAAAAAILGSALAPTRVQLPPDLAPLDAAAPAPLAVLDSDEERPLFPPTAQATRRANRAAERLAALRAAEAAEAEAESHKPAPAVRPRDAPRTAPAPVRAAIPEETHPPAQPSALVDPETLVPLASEQQAEAIHIGRRPKKRKDHLALPKVKARPTPPLTRQASATALPQLAAAAADPEPAPLAAPEQAEEAIVASPPELSDPGMYQDLEPAPILRLLDAHFCRQGRLPAAGVLPDAATAEHYAVMGLIWGKLQLPSLPLSSLSVPDANLWDLLLLAGAFVLARRAVSRGERVRELEDARCSPRESLEWLLDVCEALRRAAEVRITPAPAGHPVLAALAASGSSEALVGAAAAGPYSAAQATRLGSSTISLFLDYKPMPRSEDAPASSALVRQLALHGDTVAQRQSDFLSHKLLHINAYLRALHPEVVDAAGPAVDGVLQLESTVSNFFAHRLSTLPAMMRRHPAYEDAVLDAFAQAGAAYTGSFGRPDELLTCPAAVGRMFGLEPGSAYTAAWGEGRWRGVRDFLQTLGRVVQACLDGGSFSPFLGRALFLCLFRD